MRFGSWILAGAALLSMSGSALADTVYSSQSAFEAAVPGTTSYSFPAVDGHQFEGTGYTIGPVTFSASNIFLFNDGAYGSGQTYLGLLTVQPVSTLSGTFGVGLTLGGFYGTEPVLIYVNGLPVDSLNVSGMPGSSFFGYVSDAPITSLAFQQAGNTELDVLNVETAPAPTPEPSSLALLGSALVGATALRKRLFRA